jgi:hypothetical protein
MSVFWPNFRLEKNQKKTLRWAGASSTVGNKEGNAEKEAEGRQKGSGNPTGVIVDTESCPVTKRQSEEKRDDKCRVPLLLL